MPAAEQNQLITALGKMDRAIDDLGAAVADYNAGYLPYARAENTVSVTRRETLEQTVGSEALNDALVRRLRAAGLGPMLQRAHRTRGTLSDLAGLLAGKIRAHVK